MKKILFLLFWACLQRLPAQQEMPKRFFWGLLAGVEQHRVSIQSIASKVSKPDSPNAAADRTGAAGAVIGAFGRWRLTRDLAIQSELLCAYAQNGIRFSPENVRENYRFLDLELPLHLVVTNTRKTQPLRASFLIGGRIGWNFASNPADKLGLLSGRTAADVGLGAEIRISRYRIQPEVVYSYGLNNLHDYLNTTYDPGISSVVRDRITLRVLVWR